ncbi:glycosyltransferase [Pelagicoccus enzymogenes]|uniref:glycosyltransferase n=1 Tax=Pelagicoccus enzymogenes TaxID=2773457 RepID=UPI00280CA5C2|nr:glycosyltransferase [Pelagicoccus enzymogenes]MDQ8199782.1 glycosyltransferase [Pelagicoccus enzymogenes]
MKILHITTVHPFGDPRIFTKQALSAKEAGHQVTVICTGAPDRHWIRDELNIISLGNRQTSPVRRSQYIPKIIKHLFKNQYDVIQIHDPELLIPLILFDLIPHRSSRIIFDIHEDYKKASMETLSKKIFFSIAYPLLYTISKLRFFHILAEDSYCDTQTRRTCVIHNYSKSKTLDTTKKRDNIIVYIGIISIDRSIREISTAFLNSNLKGWELALIGNTSGPEVDSIIKKLTENKKPEKTIKHYGFMDIETAKNEILSKSKIGLSVLQHHKNYEYSLPSKVFDYLSVGLPVILSDFPFYLKTFQDFPSIRFVSAQFTDRICTAMNDLIDYDRIKNQVIDSLEILNKRFTWESESKKLLSFYESITALDRTQTV